ncbi:MAG: hypothetical protein KDD70_08075, partial [Bdellovibrionales bacterium]|nr:hypothetical protein [Bdellovibrionales bacterium]
WDQEAQVYLNRMRARDPYNSRFLQRDPVVRHMLDGFDEYTVLGNNSLSNFDPVGGQWWGRGRWGRKPHNTPDGGDHDGPSSRRPTHDDSPSGVRPIPRGPDVEPAPGTGRPSLPPADDGITPPGSARKPNPTTPEGSGAGTGGAGKTPDTDGGGGAGSDAGEAGNGNGGGDVGGESGPITGGPKTKPCPSDVKKPPSTEGMEGTPGPGIDQSHLDAVQDLANKTGKTIIVHGSRQTGKKNKPGHPDHGKPWCEGSDVDLGVTKADDLLDLADYTDDWRSIHPDIEHNPMAIMSEADALAAGYLVIRPTGGGSGGG